VSQVNRSAIAQPARVRRSHQYIAAAVAMTVVATVVVGAFIVRSANAPSAISIPAAHQELVDGWLPAANAAGVARLDRVQDGYLSGLINARQGGDLADGYLSGLINARQGGDLADGYLGGLIAARSTGDLVDGWESALGR